MHVHYHFKNVQKHLNDLIHNVKLLNNDERKNYANNFPSTSTAASSSKRNPRINNHKRFSLENSIDADVNNFDVSFAFPHEFEKYSDDIWRKTVSSDCDQSIPVWEKQPEPNMTMWGTSSGFYEPPRNSHFYDNDIFSTGGNFFFPTSGASTSTSRRLSAADTKPSSRRKQYGSRVPTTSNTTSVALESDDEFQTIKKRLSLSSLRTSLCRQKALENLNNNENQGAGASVTGGASTSATGSGISGSNDDFLQVFMI